jgi:hypothetical protein
MLGVALDFSQGYNIFKHESKDQSLELDYSNSYQIPFGCASSIYLASYGRKGPLNRGNKEEEKGKTHLPWMKFQTFHSI